MFLVAQPLKPTPFSIATQCFSVDKLQLITLLVCFNGDKNICQT
jgi:hypothetical protein